MLLVAAPALNIFVPGTGALTAADGANARETAINSVPARVGTGCGQREGFMGWVEREQGCGSWLQRGGDKREQGLRGLIVGSAKVMVDFEVVGVVPGKEGGGNTSRGEHVMKAPGLRGGVGVTRDVDQKERRDAFVAGDMIHRGKIVVPKRLPLH